MHIIAILFFLTILSLAVGVIFMTVADYRDKIVVALLGRQLVSHETVVLISNRSYKRRVPPVANENFSLPLAA